MSDHKKPLTIIEETGLILHGFGCDIGKPSLCADIFRHGVAWGQTTVQHQIEDIRRLLQHDMPFDDNLRERLADLLITMEQTTEEQLCARIMREQCARIAKLENALHCISLASANSMSSKEDCGREARKALDI